MRLSDFDYHLPKHMIVQQPATPRDSSRLMIIDKHTIYHRSFNKLPEFLRPGDLIILNESRVIPARLQGSKETGGKVEVLLVKQQKENNYEWADYSIQQRNYLYCRGKSKHKYRVPL